MKHEPKPPRRKLRDLGPIIRRRPAVFAVYLVLRLIVIAVLTAAVFAWGFVTTPAAYTVVVLLINGFTYGVVLCFGILAANWFPTKKGLAIGWITMGYNVATVSANWILTFGWKHFGFHGGFNIVAICGVLTFIFVLLAARENPEDVGANPDNDPDMTMEQALELRRQGCCLDSELFPTLPVINCK